MNLFTDSTTGLRVPRMDWLRPKTETWPLSCRLEGQQAARVRQQLPGGMPSTCRRQPWWFCGAGRRMGWPPRCIHGNGRRGDQLDLSVNPHLGWAAPGSVEGASGLRMCILDDLKESSKYLHVPHDALGCGESHFGVWTITARLSSKASMNGLQMTGMTTCVRLVNEGEGGGVGYLQFHFLSGPVSTYNSFASLKGRGRRSLRNCGMCETFHFVGLRNWDQEYLHHISND